MPLSCLLRKMSFKISKLLPVPFLTPKPCWQATNLPTGSICIKPFSWVDNEENPKMIASIILDKASNSLPFSLAIWSLLYTHHVSTSHAFRFEYCKVKADVSKDIKNVLIFAFVSMLWPTIIFQSSFASRFSLRFSFGSDEITNGSQCYGLPGTEWNNKRQIENGGYITAYWGNKLSLIHV